MGSSTIQDVLVFLKLSEICHRLPKVVLTSSACLRRCPCSVEQASGTPLESRWFRQPDEDCLSQRSASRLARGRGPRQAQQLLEYLAGDKWSKIEEMALSSSKRLTSFCTLRSAMLDGLLFRSAKSSTSAISRWETTGSCWEW